MKNKTTNQWIICIWKNWNSVPELRKTWLNFFVSRFRVVILLICLISAWGIYSYIQLPRESNPEVKVPIAVVSTVYPGVGPSDIEELVTKKLEAGIAGLKNIKQISSNSYNSVSSIVVEFEASANLDDSIRNLRDEVTSLAPSLPDDANEPVVTQISFDDTPILTVAFTGPFDGFTLRSIADDIKDDLEKLPDVREVVVSGGDEREFRVSYDPNKLTFYTISPDQANTIIAATNLAIPAGNFEGSEYVYPVRADARFYTAEELGAIPLLHTDKGAIVYLKDVARVEETAIKHTVMSRFSSDGSAPQPDVTISVIKKTGGNIINTVDSAYRVLDDKIKALPAGTKYVAVSDFAKDINDNFTQLTHDFILTMILVFSILFFVVGIKEAFVAGLAVPLVFFVTFGVMNLTGITLNFLSIFSLILSLGLLVDDAIVVVSATKQYMATGKYTPEEAVLLVLNDFKVVLTTTTLTTVWAFLPLLLATGIIGSFIKSIPITVSVTLISSLLIALMINHPLAAVLERIRLTKLIFFPLLLAMFPLSYLAISTQNIFGYALAAVFFAAILLLIRWYMRRGRSVMRANAALVRRERKDDSLIKEKLRSQTSGQANRFERLIHGVVSLSRVLPYYDRFLCDILTHRKRRITVVAVTFGLFILAVALPATGVVPVEFFPASDETLIFINMRAATGLNLEHTNALVERAEEMLLKYPEIKNFSTIVGRSSSGSDIGPTSNSSNLASITINLVDKDRRHITSYDLADKIREEYKNIPEATFSVESLSGGPPAGSAFEARIIGDDLQTLDRIAADLKPVLTSIPGVVNADISLREAPAEYTFELEPDRMELYNLNAAYVGSILRTAITGSQVSTVIIGGKEIDVRAEFDEDKIPDLEAVQNIQLLNLAKKPVFIKDVAKISLVPSVESVYRIDQKRAIVLSAGVAGQTRANAVLAEFQKKLAAGYTLPTGYTIAYGGENEQNVESVQSIIKAMILAGLLIIATLIIQFDSIKKPLIVLMTIPLALIGVFFGMAIARINLSFPGLIGILALFGIVVKNAIILIDKINLNLRFKIPFEDAIIDAGKSRLEAILITSITTILGIIPITLSNALWRALGGAIIFGLMLSSFLTLFIIPILYYMLFKKSEGADMMERVVKPDQSAD